MDQSKKITELPYIICKQPPKVVRARRMQHMVTKCSGEEDAKKDTNAIQLYYVFLFLLNGVIKVAIRTKETKTEGRSRGEGGAGGEKVRESEENRARIRLLTVRWNNRKKPTIIFIRPHADKEMWFLD